MRKYSSKKSILWLSCLIIIVLTFQLLDRNSLFWETKADYVNRKADQKYNLLQGLYADLSSGKEKKRKYIFVGDSRCLTLGCHPFSNFSRRGMQVSHVLEISDQIDFSGCHFVVISLGLNDILAGYSFESTALRMESLIQGIMKKKTNTKIVLTSIVDVKNVDLFLRPKIHISEQIGNLNHSLQNLALRNEQVHFLELSLLVEDIISDDGVHFSDKGQLRFNKLLCDRLNVIIN